MKNKSVISYYSLFAAMLAVTPASAGVRIGNISRSYADSYNQVNNLRMGTVGGQNATVQNAGNYMPASANQGVTTAVNTSGVVIDLPIRVANADLAKRIGLGETVGNTSLDTLERCRLIYPDGEFAWDTPTMGVGSGGAQTCVSVVEMRAANPDGRGGYVVLARANLAAGDSFKCNISDFPEYSYTAEAGNIEFPSDREPTVEDVVAQLNQEQKQNAGLKIAAGALIGAIGGNIAGKGERGSDSLLGTGKDKMKASAIGAVSGAALMVGNAYAGKVGGDMVLSAGVNAAAGGIMANMMASGNSVLRIEECNTPYSPKDSCLWGTVVKTRTFDIGPDKTIKAAFYNISSSNDEVLACEVEESGVYSKCSYKRLRNIRLKDAAGKTLEQLRSANNFADLRAKSELHFKYDKTTGEVSQKLPDDTGIYVAIDSATEEDGMPLRAMVSTVHDKAMGYTADDWSKQNKAGLQLWGRDADDKGYKLDDDSFTLDNFRPTVINAEDGGLVDISNKARLKTTLTGAGVGGAMGGFVGYQGAKSDIDDRWVTAVREYKDSLTRVYCQSGSRYLGQYNSSIAIPALTEE